MQVPKRKTSKSKRNMRRAHDGLVPSGYVLCSKCQEPKLRHHICPECGQYRGRQMVELPSGE
ncbi:MAG: 50S ribosomal protein L32 [Deltaproteobacteria bacterium]|nr:50S ribosomal protein L32 [Deltaproteobacteria bacterium]